MPFALIPLYRRLIPGSLISKQVENTRHRFLPRRIAMKRKHSRISMIRDTDLQKGSRQLSVGVTNGGISHKVSTPKPQKHDFTTFSSKFRIKEEKGRKTPSLCSKRPNHDKNAKLILSQRISIAKAAATRPPRADPTFVGAAAVTMLVVEVAVLLDFVDDEVLVVVLVVVVLSASAEVALLLPEPPPTTVVVVVMVEVDDVVNVGPEADEEEEAEAAAVVLMMMVMVLVGDVMVTVDVESSEVTTLVPVEKSVDSDADEEEESWW